MVTQQSEISRFSPFSFTVGIALRKFMDFFLGKDQLRIIHPDKFTISPEELFESGKQETGHYLFSAVFENPDGSYICSWLTTREFDTLEEANSFNEHMQSLDVKNDKAQKCLDEHPEWLLLSEEERDNNINECLK